MTSSDAIMLAQLAATLLIATSVAYVGVARSSVELSRLTKFNAYASIVSLGLSVVLALLMAAFSPFASSSSAALYIAIIAGLVTTAGALWGQIDAALAARKPSGQ